MKLISNIIHYLIKHVYFLDTEKFYAAVGPDGNGGDCWYNYGPPDHEKYTQKSFFFCRRPIVAGASRFLPGKIMFCAFNGQNNNRYFIRT